MPQRSGSQSCRNHPAIGRASGNICSNSRPVEFEESLNMSAPSQAHALHVKSKAAGIEALQLDCNAQAQPQAAKGEVVVQVLAAAVNPSDVKATLGIMPHAVFPRTPGRDFAGLVVDGPFALKGLKVWGSPWLKPCCWVNQLSPPLILGIWIS